MPKYQGPHHGRHHGPAGLHQIVGRLQEMRDLGASDEDIQDVLALLKDKLPKGFAESPVALDECDEGATIAQCADDANRKVLEVLRNSLVLIAGEMRPHLISPLLDEGISVTQVHDATPHGHRPPHFRDLTHWYPARFCGALSFIEVKDAGFTAILIDVFLDEQGVALASPLAMMASRLWPEATVVAVLSDHCAPHHVGPIGRNVDLYLYWE